MQIIKYFFSGTTFVVLCSFSMDSQKKSLLMPQVKLSEDAWDILDYSKCSPDTVCGFSRDDEKLDKKTRENIAVLRSVFQKKFNNEELQLADLQNASKNVHVVVALLALLQGNKRDLFIRQLTGYAVQHEGSGLLQFLEWHGFKANRLPENILKQIEEFAQSQSIQSKKYLMSLRNPREYNIE